MGEWSIEAANQALALLAVFVYTTHAMQAIALRAFEWKPGLVVLLSDE